jgi:hypothetical protein
VEDDLKRKKTNDARVGLRGKERRSPAPSVATIGSRLHACSHRWRLSWPNRFSILRAHVRTALVVPMHSLVKMVLHSLLPSSLQRAAHTLLLYRCVYYNFENIYASSHFWIALIILRLSKLYWFLACFLLGFHEKAPCGHILANLESS